MPTNNAINTGKPIEVTKGGTQKASFTAYAPIVGGTTATGPLQSADTGFSNVNYVLTSTGNASLPTWQASSSAGTGGLVLLSSQTVTNVGAVNFTSVLSSSYNNYVLTVVNYLPSVNDTSLVMQYSSDNGGTWVTNDYYAGTLLGPQNSIIWTNYNSSLANPFGFLFMARVNSAGSPGSGTMNLYSLTSGIVGSTVRESVTTAQCDNFVDSTRILQLSSSRTNTTTMSSVANALRAVSTSGNIAQGTFSLYAYVQ